MSTRRKPSWKQLKAKRHNTRVSTDIVTDSAAAQEADRLNDELVRLGDAAPRELAERVAELERQAADSKVTFVFEGIGRSAYEALRDEHPVSEEEKAKGASFGPGFMPALMAASCVEPVELRGDLDEWTEIYDEWSYGLTHPLSTACQQANLGANQAPKSSRASEILARNDSETS